jgi:hypothetical protein
MLRIKVLPDINCLLLPLHEGKVSRLFCTNCGSLHELNLGQSQVFSWTVDRNNTHQAYDEIYFQADSCPNCNYTYKNLQIKKIELIPIYNELCKDYYLN